MSARYASGLAHAARATPALAARAVEQALSRLGQPRAASVLLFLSADFAHDPRPALLAAARTAQTMSVAGCTALGVLSDDDWLLDTPAASALVSDEMPPLSPGGPRLTLTAPNTLDLAWLEAGPARYGGIAGDATGLGPYKVWRQSQLAPDGRCELVLPLRHAGLSRGMVAVGAVHRVSDIDGFDLKTLDGRLAAATLRRSVPHLPAMHELALATLDEQEQVADCWPLVSVNPDSSVTVAARLFPGQPVRWMQRSAQIALDEIRSLVAAPPPAAGLLFSCGGRGPALHDGLDREWQTITGAWPGVPLAGFYGNGQIIRHAGVNRLLHQSVVLASLD